ncbi:PPE domain-containing protein [Saccharothrix sp. 6-C]|uniref:PPE domain-containing protein n=1 Tax=Saccharothrix sp. 6-C TaxID=2781735 RepID=UPI0019178E92|nr:PPE domain-containing protein [Saccharothrix sp. 6-C]QQQ78039.1 PPE domain-containing protein [Saccharothrix sp. 6-C]
MGGIGNYNFHAQSHKQLYEKIHDGPGHSAAQAVDDLWNSFQVVMGNAKSELESAIRDSKAVWVGVAGEKFTGSTAPLVQWAEDALTAGAATQKSFDDYTKQYIDAETRMPEPVEVTSTANDKFFGIPAAIVHKLDGQTDQDIQEKQAQEAKNHAVDVMNSYRDSAAATVDRLGTFVPPPQVTTQVTEPTFQQSEAQSQYSRQFSDRQWNGDTGTSRMPSQPQQPVPQAVAPTGGDTSTSAVGTTPDIAPRPGPTPITPPPYTPGPPQPPVAVPPPGMIRPNPGFYDRRTPPGGNPPGKGTGPGVPKGFGGNPAGGTPRFGGGLPGVPGQPGHGGQPFGPGSSTGVGGDAHTNRTAQAGAAGARGAAGSPMTGGMAGAPQGGKGEDDIEHKAAPYLEELDDVWGEDSMPRVAPPVIGDDGS